ncbi:hypothetical protein [Bdellovibrio reynosensis]|uniref:Uncharacterized protein n=1 Tax=Bdellovibrio reynosensis TaxID=2835041 RepID=A0ABY4CA73_9BACT|nr:hypothetical protein [Bdellovibrio reynosensis]UOF00586.1 hypothetical protein MNR06_12845 [Bdellovibrio reynosensis]
MKFLGAVLVFVFFGSIASANTTYELKCKMSDMGAVWRSLNSSNVLSWMSFKQSPTKYTDSLPQGYCAWMDRGMHPSEPTTLAEISINIMSIYEVTYKGMPTLVSAPSAWVANSKVPGKVMTFKVFATTVPGLANPVLRYIP